MARRRFEFDPDRSQVWIEGSSSVHPIHANATGLEGWVELDATRNGLAAKPNVAGEVRIAVDRLRSGNPLVDRETRRRVDARRHPFIVGRALSSTRVDATTVRLQGEIEFRGETRTVEGELTLQPEGAEMRLVGSQRFDVRDWGLQPPKVGFLQVHPDVDVRLDACGVLTA